MQACAEEARGQLPHMNGKGGDCWVVAIACAPIQDVKGWQPPLLNELETVATIIDQRTSGAAMDAYK